MSKPVQPIKKASIQGTRKPKKRRNLGILLLVLILVGGGTFGYKHIQKDRAIAKERTEYNAAETDLNNLADQIVAKFGRPADRKELNACGYTSQEFGRGALYCNVGLHILYSTADLASSIQLAHNVEGTSLRGGQVKQIYDPSPLVNHVIPVDILSEDFISNTLRCFIDYSHYDSDTLSTLLVKPQLSFGSSSQGLVIEMDCSSRTPKAVYYPVAD